MKGNRDFQDILTDLDDGKVHEQLTEQLPRLVAAVRETGKGGSLTLTIKVTKEKERMVMVTATVKATLPQKATERTLFFTSDDGVISREDPKQPTLRHVPMRPATPIKPAKEGGEE